MRTARRGGFFWPAFAAWLILGIAVSYWLTTTYEDNGGQGTLSARIGVRSATLEGTVPTQAIKSEIGARAAELVGGAGNVTNNIEVDSGIEGGQWLNAAIGGLAGLPVAPRPLSYRVVGGTLTLTGEAASEQERDALLQTVAELSQSVFEIDDQVTVATGSSGATPSAPTAAETLQKEIDAVLAGRVVEFATGKATLTARGKRVLDGAVPGILAAPAVRLGVYGYTDNTGDPKENRKLSRQRAQTVVAYLVAHGVEASRLTSAGFGAANPVASNKTEAGRAKNRRIELRVIGGS